MGTLGGKRPGAGRKKGTKLPATLEREATLAAFRQRGMKLADILLDSQLTLARGQTFLYRIDKEWIKTGVKKNGEETGYWRNKKPVQVTSEPEIREYLERETDKFNGDAEDDQDAGAAYYFMTAKEPSNQAVDSILDRTFGKSTTTVSGPDGGPIQVAGVEISIRK